jgi:hypothetical protein
MRPEQTAAFDAIMGITYRVAMKIADLPKEERAIALEIARRSFAEAISACGVTNPTFIDICTEGIAVVLQEIEASGSPSGGHA